MLFFSSPPFLPLAVFFVLLSYFFVTVILDLLGLIIKKPDFRLLFTHLTEILLGWISKSRLHIQCILLIITPNKASMFSVNAVYNDMNNDISTLRTVDKSGRGRNLTRKHWGRECLPTSSTKIEHAPNSNYSATVTVA